MSDITKHDHRYFWCKKCFCRFQAEDTLARHKQLCTRENFISNVRVLPETGSSIKFTNWKFITMAPFVIYADLESVLTEVDITHGKTHLYQKHKCCAASAVIRSAKLAEMDGKFFLFTGENALRQLLDQLIESEAKCIEYLETNRAMRNLTEAQRNRNLEATVCCICRRVDRPFDGEHADWRKVHDHDHVTGYYIGAAHDLCNRQRKVIYDVPVFFHNLRGYDGHLIVKEMATYPGRAIKPIGQNMERYLQIKWGRNMVFRDSLQFLAQLLQTLVDSLSKCEKPNQPIKFSMLERVIGERHPAAPWKRFLRKGVFPYEHVKTFATLDEQQLPPRAAFYSSLTGETCSEDDYGYAQSVWREFGCRSLREYMQLYLTTDVCLLADVFENFRATCHEAYELDPASSCPRRSWRGTRCSRRQRCR